MPCKDASLSVSAIGWPGGWIRGRFVATSCMAGVAPPLDDAAQLLADEVVAGRLSLKGWDHDVEQWILRLNLLCQWFPELGLPPVTDPDRRALVEQLCHGAFTYKEIKDKPVKPIVKS